MTTLRGHFDGKVIVPDEPVDLPRDQQLVINVESEAKPFDWSRLAGSISDEDAALMKIAHNNGPILPGQLPKATLESGINNSQGQRDRQFFELADLYLNNLVKTRILDSHDAIDSEAQRFLSRYFLPQRLSSIGGKDGLFSQIVHSSQDSGMATGVIGKPIGGVHSLDSVLFGFDPIKVNQTYPNRNDWPRLLDEIIRQLNPPGKIRREPNSLWPRFCRSIISGAKFLRRFETVSDFYKWADALIDDRCEALPEALAREIEGFGFAIACIFLMDIGYPDFAKPDVHVREILVGLGLTSGFEDCEVFKAACRIAANAHCTPYKLDRICWLIASGKFWLDGIEVGGHRDDFIAYARSQLQAAT